MNCPIIGTGGAEGRIGRFPVSAGKDLTCTALGKHPEAIRHVPDCPASLATRTVHGQDCRRKAAQKFQQT